MKFKAIYSSMALLFGATLFLNNSTGPVGTGNGDRSGASGTTCNSCHGGGGAGAVTTVVDLLDSTNNVQTSYLPNARYKIRVASAAPNPPSTYRYGFNMSARTGDNSATIGTLSLIPGSVGFRVTGGVAEHTTPSNIDLMEVYWVAPPAGTGNVKLYASALAANMDGTSSNDVVSAAAVVDITEAVVSNVRQAVELSQFVVFPTQAESQINLRFAAAEAGQYTAEVVNINGQVLSTQVFAANQGEQTQSVEVNNLATGTYFVRLRNNQNTIGTKAFVKF